MTRDECEHGQLRRSCEICELQSTVNAQQDTIGVLKRKLSLAGAECDALRQRIESAPVAIAATFANGETKIACAGLPKSWCGKRVHLVAEVWK